MISGLIVIVLGLITFTVASSPDPMERRGVIRSVIGMVVGATIILVGVFIL